MDSESNEVGAGKWLPLQPYAPFADRNKDEILAVLKEFVPEAGTVLEIGCGKGLHSAYFAGAFPALRWLPTDRDAEVLQSAQAWVSYANLPNLREPVVLDVQSSPWPVERADFIVAVNVIHISAWSTCERLFSGAAQVLSSGQKVFMYGPFLERNGKSASSNLAFDRKLKARNPEWGVRQVAAVVAAASASGFELSRAIEMPNNNKALIFKRT